MDHSVRGGGGNYQQPVALVGQGGRGQTTTLNTVTPEYLAVSACGRSVAVPMREAQSCASVKAVVQRDLKMHGQEFELYDCLGTSLMTDTDLRMAISKGHLPITATLSESSVHFIENRREELAQMQWKLLRDKIDSVASKANIVGQQLGQLSDAFATHQVQQQEGDRRLQLEFEAGLEDTKEHTRALCAQISERVEAVSQLVHSERNMREALKEGVMRQIQGTLDALEADRTTRRTEMTSTLSTIQDLRRALHDESRERAGAEDRHIRDMQALQDRIDGLSRNQAEYKQDLEIYMKQLTTSANKELEEHNRTVLQLRSGVESAHCEVANRFQKLEDNHTNMENRLKEQSTRHATQYGQLWSKQKDLQGTVEQVRLKDRGEQLNSFDGKQELCNESPRPPSSMAHESSRVQQQPQQQHKPAVRLVAGGSLAAPVFKSPSAVSVSTMGSFSVAPHPGARIISGGSLLVPNMAASPGYGAPPSAAAYSGIYAVNPRRTM